MSACRVRTAAQRAAQREYQARPEVVAKRKVWMREWYAKNPHEARDRQRKCLYGAPSWLQHWMLVWQQYACPITGDAVTIASDLDHDHRARRPRAFVSRKANILIGAYERSAALTERLLRYAAERSELWRQHRVEPGVYRFGSVVVCLIDTPQDDGIR